MERKDTYQVLDFSSGEFIEFDRSNDTGVSHVESTLHSDDDSQPVKAGLDMLDAVLLALFNAGVDLEKHAEAIEQVVHNFYKEWGE